MLTKVDLKDRPRLFFWLIACGWRWRVRSAVNHWQMMFVPWGHQSTTDMFTDWFWRDINDRVCE